MPPTSTRHRVVAATAVTLLAVGLVGTGAAVVATVAAGTGSGPTEVYRCGQAAQRYHTGPRGEVTLVKANGTTVTFPELGDLVSYLQQTGICR